MSLTNIEEFMPEKLAKAIANPLFPTLDNALRSGRHVSSEDLDNHSFLIEFEKELAMFYRRYNAELIRAPEGFLYLRPRSTSLIGRSVLSEIDMLVGKVLCFLYLSPERLAHEGIFTNQELFDELLVLADEQKLMKLVTNRASGSDLDREKLFDKVKTSLRRLRRLGMLIPIGENGKFRISESVFRFGADVRTGDDVREAQLRLIRDGEAVVHQQASSQSSLLDDIDTNNQEVIEIQQNVEQSEPEGSI
ncbi:chromosome partition protein MukE [Photobacterium phosphoreum]|uniref:Chromosome partition protein MukE n=1 Tax=Photobacterium phosphoreum TaxID=659 RepID=A0AAW4ZIT7_PHOPO|nr:chromosome partition protein MukE [Photobacterium phosphoreum]MCD9469696.1 chromosome partitioning protein MukE [Photobacterium phosphoreum]MCD9473620.1 chromosome partition protein MukE [Photobacterium phosphoreum]MCD9489663.1 chromosome partition protein MukE [Photobacterium phosphoreum]MCD9500982.1 chromosome partition protein MukE [Photobacterium phosphoreum]MCD9505164.1 chromosome partition protein MukE [Photobacterium phosphoreum]